MPLAHAPCGITIVCAHEGEGRIGRVACATISSGNQPDGAII